MLMKSRRRSIGSLVNRTLITIFCVSMASAAYAQNDAALEDDFEDDFEEVEEATAKKEVVNKQKTGKETTELVESEAAAVKKETVEPAKKQLVPDFDDSGFVETLDRLPPKDMPLILGKKYHMANHVELSASYVHTYGDRLLHHSGLNLAASYHVFDWLAVEGFATTFYPSELGIMDDVRQRGHSVKEKGLPTALSGLWQTFATGGIGAEWSPLYGKLSFLSEFDVSFQFYLFGGVAVSGIAKVDNDPTAAVVINKTDFYDGLLGGQNYKYTYRIDAAYGAGLRVYPVDWMAIRFDLRNLTGLNPPVEEATYSDKFDLNNMPMLQIGLSFLL